MRKDLESWIRGNTAQGNEIVSNAIELQLPLALALPVAFSLTEREEPSEVQMNADTEAEPTKSPEEIEEVENAEENEEDTESAVEESHVAVENFSQDDFEDERQISRELFEEADSLITKRLEHIKTTGRLPRTHGRSGFRKDRVRFFTICLVVILAVGTAIALYRNMQRNSFDAMIERAHGLYAQEQFAVAFEAYRETSQRHPNRIESFLGAARSAERLGHVDNAIAAYRSALELIPASAAHLRSNVFYEIGLLYSRLGAWDRAQGSFEEAIAADAANYRAHFSLGNALEEQDQPDMALLAYRQALSLSPSSEAAREAIRLVSLVLDDREVAEQRALRERQYEQAIQSGDVALEDGRYREASDYFAAALAIRSDDADAWVGFGEARFRLGDLGGAITSMERALERDPEHERARVRLAEIEEQRRRNVSMRRSAPRSRLLNLAADTPPPPTPAALTRATLFDTGVELYRKGEYAKAFDSFVASLHAPERGPLSPVSLAGDPGPVGKGFQVRLSIPSDARLLAEAVQLNPMDRNLYVNLVMAAAKTGINRQTMRSTLNEAHSHALLRTSAR